MKVLGLLLAASAVLAAKPTTAMVLAVPVPELLGNYSSAPNQDPTNYFRQVTIHLPASPSVIHSVALRVHGTSSFAEYSCDGYGGYGPPTPVPTSIGAELTEASSDDWIAEHSNLVSGEVSFTQAFSASIYSSGTWTFLLDGTANMNFVVYGIPAIPECYLVGPADLTVLDEVTLLVDGEFPTPATTTSWGSVKSIYR